MSTTTTARPIEKLITEPVLNDILKDYLSKFTQLGCQERITDLEKIVKQQGDRITELEKQKTLIPSKDNPTNSNKDNQLKLLNQIKQNC